MSEVQRSLYIKCNNFFCWLCLWFLQTSTANLASFAFSFLERFSRCSPLTSKTITSSLLHFKFISLIFLCYFGCARNLWHDGFMPWAQLHYWRGSEMLLTYNFQLIFDTIIYFPCCSIDFRRACTLNGWRRKFSFREKYLDFLDQNS